MQFIVQEIDGRKTHVEGVTVPSRPGDGIRVRLDDPDDLYPGAAVRCAYAEPSGVHMFSSTVTDMHELALSLAAHVVFRLPEGSEKIQRRSHVRVAAEVDGWCRALPDGDRVPCRAMNVSGGGVALSASYRQGTPGPEEGSEVEVELPLGDETFVLHGVVVGVSANDPDDCVVVRTKFEDVPTAVEERLVKAVFVLQRELLRKQSEQR